MIKILQRYPFMLLEPPLRLVEGFAAYDGNLKDKPGEPHKGIDYIRKLSDKFESFEIFSAHPGETFQGLSKTWGKFVVIRKKVSPELRYDTIYAHLRSVTDGIPQLPKKDNKNAWPEDVEQKPFGLQLESGVKLGVAGITGKTNRIIQLHFELHEIKNSTRQKLDPYGLNLRFSSGKYPQPGKSLAHLNHFWESDNPPFAK